MVARHAVTTRPPLRNRRVYLAAVTLGVCVVETRFKTIFTCFFPVNGRRRFASVWVPRLVFATVVRSNEKQSFETRVVEIKKNTTTDGDGDNNCRRGVVRFVRSNFLWIIADPFLDALRTGAKLCGAYAVPTYARLSFRYVKTDVRRRPCTEFGRSRGVIVKP